jgi:hypothetical protein
MRGSNLPLVNDVGRKCNLWSGTHAHEVQRVEDRTEGLVLWLRQGRLVMVGCDFSVSIMRRCHGHLRGCDVRHAVRLHNLIGVLFLRETNRLCSSVSDDVHPEDKLGLAKV